MKLLMSTIFDLQKWQLHMVQLNKNISLWKILQTTVASSHIMEKTQRSYYKETDTWLTSLVAQIVKNLPAMQETQIQSLGWEDSGEGNGSPLQYSYLENPMDRGPWQATVHGVTKRWTRLCNYHFTSLYFIHNYKKLKKI